MPDDFHGIKPDSASHESSRVNEPGKASFSADEPVISASGVSRVPHSCAEMFDSMYFCFSPVHQSTFYYRNGEWDNCRGRIERFRLCAMSRLRSSEDSEVRVPRLAGTSSFRNASTMVEMGEPLATSLVCP